MIVIHVSKCPERLKGDLTKWLYPIGTGLYVGSVNAKIREYLWERVLEYISDGSAVMTYDAKTESGVELRLHNVRFSMRDYDGLQLPFAKKSAEVIAEEDDGKDADSSVVWRMPHRRARKAVRESIRRIAFLDIETTGLSAARDSIIEIGVVCVDGDDVVTEWSSLVKIDRRVPEKVRLMTGISDEMLEEGVCLDDALRYMAESISGRDVFCYNVKFDIPVLDRELVKNGMLTVGGMCVIRDVMVEVKRYFRSRDGPSDYSLESVAKWFEIDVTGVHRALQDCRILYQVWMKLNENCDS